MSNKLVSINILTYSGLDLIEQCLNSVLEQTYPNIEVLVVDNGSEDKTLEKIQITKSKFRRFPIKIIENKKNLGFSAGHNIGIRESKGEYVLCLNQDVVLDKDFIKYAVEAIEKDNKIGAVQGKLYKISNLKSQISKILDVTGLIIFKNRRVVARGQGEEDRGQYKAGEIFGADGAAPLYCRSALEDIKLNGEYFDENFFMYKEDVDLAWRMRLYGWKAIYEPRAFGYHPRGAGERVVKNYISVALERRKLSEFAKFCSFKNQRLMQIKNELPALFFRDFYRIITKEIVAWLYVLLFEKYGWKSIRDLIKQVPKAWQKRKIIMQRKQVGAKEMKRWFI